MDLLFAKVGDVDKHQQKLEAQFEMPNSVMAQMLRDQEKLAKQMEAIGQAIAHLSLQQQETHREPPPSPMHSDDEGEFSGNARRPFQQQRNTFPYGRGGSDNRNSNRNFVPKLTCPKFDGANPGIWKTKCQDYFHLLNVPESMWTTVASLHMEGNAKKWMQFHKLKYGVGTWEQFMQSVQHKFGAFEYQTSIEYLLELQ